MPTTRPDPETNDSAPDLAELRAWLDNDPALKAFFERLARVLVYKVCGDIGDGFIRAIDCRTKCIIGKGHVLEDGAVVKIVVR